MAIPTVRAIPTRMSPVVAVAVITEMLVTSDGQLAVNATLGRNESGCQVREGLATMAEDEGRGHGVVLNQLR